MSEIIITPATETNWPDLEALFGVQGGCSQCWCQYWRTERPEFRAGQAQGGHGNRLALRALVGASPAPGLLAYVDGRPAGWVQVTPRSTLIRLRRSRNLRPVDDGIIQGAPVWVVSCFFVAKPFRGRGLMDALTVAGMNFARQHGAKALEAYPHVVPPGAVREGWAVTDLFTGVASVLLRHGFCTVAAHVPHRPIMRVTL